MKLTPTEDAILEREMEALDEYLDQRARFNGGNYAPGAAGVVAMAEAIREMERLIRMERVN